MDLNLYKYNQHWEKGFGYPYRLKRRIFAPLVRHLDSRLISELVGLRRTGKTILFLQLINHLVNQGVNPFSVWYFTFDERVESLNHLLAAFAQATQIDWKKTKIYFFLDEVQKLPDFSNQLKIYFDLYPHIKWLISGSSSLFVRRKSLESLAGRTQTFTLKPLNFTEYLDFKHKNELKNKPLVFKTELESEFSLYLESQLIDSLSLTAQERRSYFTSLVKKVIYEDIPRLFPVSNPEYLWQIVNIIAQKPGLLVNYQSLSRELGISHKTISAYLYYLEESFLVKKVYNFSKNMATSQKKLKKYYLSSPSFSWALADFAEPGGLAENLVASLNDYRFFWRDPYQHEVDFVDLADRRILPIEVKYQEKIPARDLKNLWLFAKKYRLEKVVVYQKTTEKFDSVYRNLKILHRPIFFA